jgi:hypothetical protein
MSDWGHSRQLRAPIVLFRFTPDTWPAGARRKPVRWAKTGCERSQQAASLFDHLVGTASNVGGTGLRGLEVDHQLELGRRLHRKIGRLLTLENAIDI